ncbi:MAG: polymer-forming cytoskeletal protein [Patescibacteria group bacterium]
MFKENQPAGETETVIGPSVKVEGDFVTEGNVVVQGTVCGTIKTSKDLKIGSKSKIFADVSAENALVAGEIQGNIRIGSRLELTSTAKVFGDVKTETLIMANGAILNGKCQMGNVKERSSRPDFTKQAKIDLKPQTTEELTENSNEENKKKKK